MVFGVSILAPHSATRHPAVMGRINQKQFDRLVAEGTAEIVSATRLPADHPLLKIPRATSSAKPLAPPKPMPAANSENTARFTIPPSVNNLYFNKRGVGRVKTPAYSKWIKANTASARTLRPPAKYPVRFCYKLCGKVNRSRDGDNISKALQDILVAEKVLEKDSLMCVTGGRWEYAPSEDEPHVVVWLEEVTAAE